MRRHVCGVKGNCVKLERYNGTSWDLISNRVSITGPGRSRETVEEDLILDCGTDGASATKKKAPGTKEIGDIQCELIWNFTANTGTRQAERVAVVGTVTGAGNLTLTLTAALLTSPVAVTVAVTEGQTKEEVAEAIRVALRANSTIAEDFEIWGEDDKVDVYARVAAANDGTMNLALALGSVTGITAVPTSSNFAAGEEGEANEDNHHLINDDFDNETATLWRIRHANTAVTGTIVHATVKEVGEPTYQPNQNVKRTVVLEPTGEYFFEGNAVTTVTLPAALDVPTDNWGR